MSGDILTPELYIEEMKKQLVSLTEQMLVLQKKRFQVEVALAKALELTGQKEEQEVKEPVPEGQRKRRLVEDDEEKKVGGRLYCDGSALGNGTKNARAGSAVHCDDGFNWARRCPGSQTNQRAELYAATVAAAYAHRFRTAIVHSDSEYVTLGINDESRLATWQQNGWKTKARTPVANDDLWKVMVAVLARRAKAGQHPLEWMWVKAHSGIKQNEIVDQMAKEAARVDEQAADPIHLGAWPEKAVGVSFHDLMTNN
jgi:ribonuclease HI